MSYETAGLPIAGGIILAGVLYALVSAFVTGPMIGERMAAKTGWERQCPAQIRADIISKSPPAPKLPRLDCNMIFGLFGPDGEDYCRAYGRHFEDNPINRALDFSQDAARNVQKQRMEHAASMAETRCSCALVLTIERRRVDLALHAGSLRLITPASVRGLHGELTNALNMPRCAAKG